MDVPEFVFELHACRWAELHWPPDGEEDRPVVVARQLGDRHRRWDTIVLECDTAGLEARRRFGSERLDGDVLHVVRHAPEAWSWYRDSLPDPGYPWRYVREAIHRAADRDILDTRKRSGRLQIRRRFPYPEWVERIVAIEHKPDLAASAADRLAAQLEYDVALGLADEVWLATAQTNDGVPPAYFERMPVEAGILSLAMPPGEATVLWHPRALSVEKPGTRILDRPETNTIDQSAARVEFVPPDEKATIRRQIAERAYEGGWRDVLSHMRPDCRHCTLSIGTLTHEPRCLAKGRAQRAAECHGRCPDFSPEPPGWRTQGWPIEGGPGKAIKRLYARQRARHR